MSSPVREESGPGWRLICGDCLDPETGLASLGEKSVDHVITDPPYDEHTHTHARSLKDGGIDIPIDFAPLVGMRHLAEMLKASRRWTLAFCSVEMIGDYADAAGIAWTRGGIWHRTDGTPQISADRPAQAAEGIAIMHNPAAKRRWNSGGKRGVWVFGVERDNRQHPTQKPLELLEALVRDFTDHGELICDPFAGSSTTGVAAIKLGRRFVGWERKPEYWEIGIRRLRAAREQLDMFESPPASERGAR